MFRNTQRHMLRHIVLLCHWLQNCKLGHGRRLRCAFASPNPSAFVANSCTHRRRDETRQFRLVGVGGVYWALMCIQKCQHFFCRWLHRCRLLEMPAGVRFPILSLPSLPFPIPPLFPVPSLACYRPPVFSPSPSLVPTSIPYIQLWVLGSIVSSAAFGVFSGWNQHNLSTD